eukprot:461674-Rhodomonas_salina.1
MRQTVCQYSSLGHAKGHSRPTRSYCPPPSRLAQGTAATHPARPGTNHALALSTTRAVPTNTFLYHTMLLVLREYHLRRSRYERVVPGGAIGT